VILDSRVYLLTHWIVHSCVRRICAYLHFDVVGGVALLHDHGHDGFWGARPEARRPEEDHCPEDREKLLRNEN